MEVAARLPDTVKIDGFDISGDQYAPATSRPKNLHVHIQDCFKPFPAKFIGSFDIVYGRFWLCLVNNPDAAVLLKNMISLLKPGGYLQWLEPLPLSAKAVHPSSKATSAAVDHLAVHWHKPTESKTYDWIEQLPELYREQDLEVIAAERIPMMERLRYFWNISLLAGLEDMAQNTSPKFNRPEDLGKWMAELMEGFSNGSYLDTSFTCVVGKKKEDCANG